VSELQLAELTGLLEIWDRTDVLERIGEEGEARVPDPARPFMVAGLARRIGPLLVVLPRSRDAEAFAAALNPWLDPGQVSLFPAWEVVPGEAISPTLDTMGRRLKVARELSAGEARGVIVSSVRAFVQKLPAPPVDSIKLETGQEASLEDITAQLAEFGFERSYLVEKPGEFSVRGGILDVFPPGRLHPFRADFFGDELSSLYEFSVSSQRSLSEASSVEIHPVRELQLTPEVRRRAAALSDEEPPPDAPDEWAADLARLSDGLAFPGMEAYLGILGEELRPIATLMRAEGRIVVCDPKQCRDRATDFLAQAEEWASAGTRNLFAGFEEALGTRAPVELWAYLRPGGRTDPPIPEGDRRGSVELGFGAVPELSLPVTDEALQLDVIGWDALAENPEKLAADLRRHRAQGATVVVAAGRAANRAREVLSEADLGLPIGPPSADVAVISTASIERGFLLRLDGTSALALVGEQDLFGRRRPVPAVAEAPARPAALLLELAPGDFIVHELYGVGRYHGMVTRRVAGVMRDYLFIEYAGDDRLYVPTEQLDAVTKYTGGESPRLNRLGTAEWERAKSRARRAVRHIAVDLADLYAKRMHSLGHAFSPDTPWQRELEDSFPYLETPDQARAIDEVKSDMERAIPMDRLICGDVGYGKTEIAVRAAFKAVQDSKQVAVLVPTTILAQQHTQTFKERFAGFPVEAAMLSRFLSRKEQQEVLERLATGKIDVVVGTHRLLQSNIKFDELGLLVVDEEQRFGVMHKEAIKRLRAAVDVLTLSATPIPRTLEMALTGVRDMSLVDTPPMNRRPVLTFVGSGDDRMVTAAIRRELARDGQVFYVHNRVRSIKRVARKIAGLVPGARVEIAHGQMSEAELERVMLDVWDGKVDVLVCTTIIESGLDIPAMNTLIVERADRLGLAQLYQLRGRVGRAGERAYAYFFYPEESLLTEEAHERLKTLSEFTELGSGFRIALRDLEIRGAGNLLGPEQSGQIAAVGFDLYARMMAEAVSELKGAQPDEFPRIRIDLPVDAFIPASYIARESLRMDAYRRIEKVRSPEDAESLREELEDRYGPPPESVGNLLIVAELRAFLAEHGISEVSARDGQLRVRPIPVLLDSQEVRLKRMLPRASYKEVSQTLLIPAVPASDLAGWVLENLRAILA
jgi:transcription-repair coupling factor (superfamily II helicase)